MVPNFVDRSIWGISHTSNFAYIDGGAPAITHTHTRGTMEISGSFTLARDLGIISVSGAFTKDAVSNADLAENVVKSTLILLLSQHLVNGQEVHLIIVLLILFMASTLMAYVQTH